MARPDGYWTVTLNATRAWNGYRFLYADTTIQGIPESRYFISLGDPQPLTDADRIIEAYRWDRGYQIRVQVKASSARDSITFKDDPSVRDDPDMTDLPEKASRVVGLLNRARGRADDSIPTEAGVCFQGGFIASPQWDSEDAKMDFVLPDRHDVSFTLETDTDVHDNTTLLQRGKHIQAAVARDPNGKTLRKGEVALQGMNAEEWLIKGTTDLRVSGFMFSMEANSLPNKEKKPVVMLDLGVGAPSVLTGDLPSIDKASLDENETLALWDAVSRTLRPRPNAFK